MMDVADLRQVATDDLASEIAARFADAVEADRVDSVSDEALGQLFASVVRIYGAKAQAGAAPRPFARNSGVTATEALIGCLAMLDAQGLNVFELGLWQASTTVGWNRSPQRVDHPE